MGSFGSKSLNDKRQTASSDGLRNKRLAFECLENRVMLASDMAEIVGIVQNDLQGDGITSNDTVVAGAIVTLYRDGGNGSFGGDDTLVETTTTNASGEYKFDELGEGRYFVQVSLPSGLQFAPGEDVKQVIINANEGDGIVGPAIDGFTTTQMVEASPPLPSSDPSSLVDSEVLGGERDMWVELTESLNPLSSVALASTGGNLYVASGPGATGNAKVVWDGLDNNGVDINYTGLGGIDLTSADGNTMTGVALTSGADHPNATITLRIYTDANNWSEFTTTVPESEGGAATGQAVFYFDDSPTAVGGLGADFTDVGALELTFEGVTALDGQVSLVGLVGRATKVADFTASPKLCLGNVVWADIDDDGILDSNESGIANVQVNLYEDVDGNNQYTQGVDLLMDQTTTDANGEYLFKDLFPGKYIVQVDPTNFNVGGALEGLVSSSGNDPATDPDDNVNSDDDGTAMAGAGVVSQAIMLSGDAEPVNDGDTDPNSNLTVDFGFYGFDLVLDKAVEQTTVAPEETIDYTIKIDNDGPSAAEDTTFVDTLPDDVTFVSASVTFNGVPFDANLQHSSGIVTAEFGTMNPGDVVIVTILATVDADATGTLVNTATVSAPKELDLSNNTDTVSNPINPTIDLAITKVDSRDPVEAGSTFTYTIDIVNNGPSDATGVVVTDNLPTTGVTYVSSSLTPATNTGDQLTFAIGDLDAGESTTITIQVRVDDDFVGTLLNHTEVIGNEVERTYTNNEDTEPTEVIPVIDLAITKVDSRDPVEPGSTFTYTIDIVNNGPSDATGVVVTDNLPTTGVTYVSSSLTPITNTGDQLAFTIGDLADGESRSITIEVRVDEDFTGTLLNHTEVSGNEVEVTYTNNEDTEPTEVVLEPASIGGTVYVDRNKSGSYDEGEQLLEGVEVTLIGTDVSGATVVETTTTDENGDYLFIGLLPGTYRIEESQPVGYRDGEETVGTEGGVLGTDPGPFLIPNDVDEGQEQDLIFEIALESGVDATDYDFGELAVNPSKGDFVGSANWW